MKSKNFPHSVKMHLYAVAGWRRGDVYLFLPGMTVNEEPSEGPFI